mgnify:CR=1 FL=1
MPDVKTLKKEEIIQMLVEKGCDQNELINMKKIELLTKLDQFELSEQSINSAITEIDNSQVVTTIIEGEPLQEVSNTLSNSTVDDTTPQISDPNWTEYVIGLLSEDEKINNNPTCDGLRRVFEILVGKIESCDMEVLQVPVIENRNHATVKCSMKYFDFHSRNYRFISDVASCNEGNTQTPYSLYPVATAATMAEGRCLRKALRIKAIANEEVLRPDDVTVQNVLDNNASVIPATDIQKKMINVLSERCGIHVSKLLHYLSSDGVSNTLDNLTHSEAQICLRKLNLYDKGPDNNGLAIPDEVLK